MVTSNWFLPEAWKADGTGVPLSITTSGGQFRDLPVYQGQPCCALLPDGPNAWRTALSASGICLFGIAPLPVSIWLGGGYRAEAFVGPRPASWRRWLENVAVGDPLQEDRALWLRLWSDGALAGEAWSEWLVSSLDDPYSPLPLQLSAGWYGEDGSAGVYAHLLAYQRSASPRSSATFAKDESRQFGVGASLAWSTGQPSPEPARIRVTTGGAMYFDPHVMPCESFTGHVIPLRHTMPYLPDSMRVSDRMDAAPSNVFGWFDHPAAAAVGHLPFPLTMSEAGNDPEWEASAAISGPRHLGSLRQYQFSDHAVVPDAASAVSNVSETASDNVRLERLNVKWTFPKSTVWGYASGVIAPPSGDFVVESHVSSHGAWNEWATEGIVPTDQSAQVATFADVYRLTLTGFSLSVSLARHTLGDVYGNTGPGSVEREAMYELRLSFWLNGRAIIEESGVQTANDPWQARHRPGQVGTTYLRLADAKALLGGQKITLSDPYSPDGRGLASPVLGVVELTAIGPP